MIASPKSDATLTDHSTPQLSLFQTPRVSKRPAKNCATLKLMARCAALCPSKLSWKDPIKNVSSGKTCSFTEFPKISSLKMTKNLFNTTSNGLRTLSSSMVRLKKPNSL